MDNRPNYIYLNDESGDSKSIHPHKKNTNELNYERTWFDFRGEAFPTGGTNEYSFYLSTFIRVPFNYVNDIITCYDAIELIYKQSIFSDVEGELKSTHFKPSHFEFGLKSLSDTTAYNAKCRLDYYIDLVNLLLDTKCGISFFYESKAILWAKSGININDDVSFLSYLSEEGYTRKSFIFGFFKLLDRYMGQQLIDVFTNKLYTRLGRRNAFVSFLKDILSKNRDAPRKINENEWIRFVIKTVSVNDCFLLFEYIPNSIALSYSEQVYSLLKFHNEFYSGSSFSLLYDESSTLNALYNNVPFMAAGLNSKDSTLIRIVDMVSGLVAKLCNAIGVTLFEDIDYIETYDTVADLRFLPTDWFIFDERTYDLYVLLSRFFTGIDLGEQYSYYRVFGTIDKSDIYYLFGLVQYIASYPTYKSFLDSGINHPEEVDTLVRSMHLQNLN